MATPLRKPRGASKDNPVIFAKVDPDIKAKWDAMVSAAGVSHVELMERLVSATEVDASGRPSWWQDDQQRIAV